MIGFDHFHVARALSKSVDQIRKTDMKNLPRLDRLHVHKNRYLWLRNGTDLDVASREKMLDHGPLMANTTLAWTLKEKARLFMLNILFIYGSSPFLVVEAHIQPSKLQIYHRFITLFIPVSVCVPIQVFDVFIQGFCSAIRNS